MTTKLSPEEARVLGALIEKSATTPDNYPLSANALRVACNQTTNRDPVVDYDQRTVDATMIELRQRGLARTVHQSGSRVPKHRHVLDDALSLAPDELAVVAVLLLRGAQTVAELTARTARYAGGPAGVDGVDAVIDRLAARDEPLVVRLARRLGEREPRVDQLMIEGEPLAEAARSPEAPLQPAGAPVERSERQPSELPASGRRSVAADLAGDADDLRHRVETLERALAEQTARIDRLAAALGDW